MRQALYHFLRNLSAQKLLTEIKDEKPWLSTFLPVTTPRTEVLKLLKSQIPALHQKEL